MKIRNGFVSNSSTSSFCIYGIRINGELKPGLESELYKLGFDVEPVDSLIYIGKSWDKIKDDETGKQFKESIIETLKPVLGDILSEDDFEFRTHKKAFYR